MGTFSIAVMIFLLVTLMSVFVIGILFYFKSKINTARPNQGLMISLGLQIAVAMLFFTNVLSKLPLYFSDMLWWAVVLLGWVIGVKNFKKNTAFSLLVITLSICLAGLGLLMFVIGSM